MRLIVYSALFGLSLSGVLFPTMSPGLCALLSVFLGLAFATEFVRTWIKYSREDNGG